MTKQQVFLLPCKLRHPAEIVQYNCLQLTLADVVPAASIFSPVAVSTALEIVVEMSSLSPCPMQPKGRAAVSAIEKAGE